MGSFNTSCFASGQTIAPGDKCIIFMIAQQRSYEPLQIVSSSGVQEVYAPFFSTCYPDSFWAADGPPLECVYDDYGEFNLLDTEDNRTSMKLYVLKLNKEVHKVDGAVDIQKFIKNNCPSFAADASSCIDEEVRWAECVKLFNHLQEMMHEPCLFKAHRQGPTNLQLAVLSSYAAEELISIASLSKNYDGTTNTAIELIKRELEPVFDNIVKLRTAEQEFREALLPLTLININIANLYSMTNRNHAGVVAKQYLDRAIQKCIEQYDPVHGLDGLVANIYEATWFVLKLNFIIAGLGYLNIKLQPMVYTGQDYNNSIGVQYAMFVNKVSTQVSLERNRDN